MRRYFYHFFAISIFAALLPCNGNATPASGDVEFEQIYNKVTGSKRVHYSSEKIKLKQKLVETTEKITSLLMHQGKLHRECSEKCAKEINDIGGQIVEERSNLTQISTSLEELTVNVNLQNAKEIGIFSAIEATCGRNYRDLYYREYYESWSNNQRVHNQGSVIDYMALYDESYLKTKALINSNEISVNCESKLLDSVYELIKEMHEKNKT